MCSDKMKCPICENGYLRQQTSKNDMSYKNQTAELDLCFSVCKFCGSGKDRGMGIKANTLRYRSKRGGEIIVGSEIRAALDELENENSELRAQLAANQEVLRCAERLYQEYFYGNDDEKAMRHNRVLVRGIHNAVRVAKENRK